MRNVIRNLAEADIVVADVSGSNWNVAYELGMRHVMSRTGTIIICNENSFRENAVPYFDINSLNVLKYPSGWMSNFQTYIDMLTDRIMSSMSDSASADSPVFDVYPALPDNVLKVLNTDNDKEQKKIKELKQMLSESEKQVASLRARLEKAGVSADDTVREETSIAEKLRKAMSNKEYISDAAVAKLRLLLEDEKQEEFVEFLGKVLENGYLDEDDCRIVGRLCRKLGIPEIAMLFYERAIEFYPENEELQAALADQYSKNYKTRDKAVAMVNTVVGVSKKSGKFEVENRRLSSRVLGMFYNVYIELNLYAEMLSISEILLKQQKDMEVRALIYRNMITSNIQLGNTEQAETLLKTLLSDFTSDDRNYTSAYRVHYALQKYEEAYQDLEKRISLDDDYEDYYYYIAGFICDESFARKSADSAPTRISGEEKECFATPFVISTLSFELSRANVERAIAFLRRNKFKSTYEKLVSLLESNCSDFREAFSDELDFSMVDFAVNSAKDD